MRSLPSDQFERSAEQARKTARIQAEFIIQQIDHLRKVDRNKRMETAARSFLTLLEAGEDLTGNQLSFLESIYERCWAGAGYPSAGVHVDQKKTLMRFGR